MSLSFLAVGYDNEIFKGGQQALFGIGNAARYNAIGEQQLADLSFDRVMRALWLNPSNTAAATAIVFTDDIFGTGPDLGDFAGRYLQIQSQPAPAGNGNRVLLEDFQLDRLVRSVLLVNAGRGTEFRISFRDTFLQTWNTTLDGLMGSQASRTGDPLMTWAAFPEGIQFLDPSQIYLRITQALNINLDWWPDYDASVTYYLFLFVDGSGRLQGFVQRWETWVEGGIKSSEISDKLAAKAQAGMDTIDATLAANFAALPSVKDLYYLPGRQLAPFNLVEEGSTLDDVTLVFET